MNVEPQKNDHILTVHIFLGSASFTALFFLLQFRDNAQYYDYLVPIVAIASILFIISSVARLNINNGRIGTNTHYATIVGVFGVFGFFLILLSVVLLIVQVNLYLGIIVGVCTLTFFAMLEITARKSNKFRESNNQ